jgi:hypothetical protein
MKKGLALGFILQGLCSPLFAQDIQTCGDLGTDNRANWCARPNGTGGLAQGRSQCRKVNDMVYEYTHCSGLKKTYTEPNQCCSHSSLCPGAYAVAICVN